MPSHYDAKKSKPKPKPFYERPSFDSLVEEINGTYHRWSDQGRECEALGGACDVCPIYTIFGRHKSSQRPEKKCFQVEANAQLKEHDRKKKEKKGIA